MVARLVLVAAAFLVVAGMERVPRLRFAPLPFLRPFLATDAAWFVLALGSSAVANVLLQPVAEHRFASPVGGLPAPLRFLVALVVVDAVAFAVHVLMHRSDLLWAVHKVHHSSLRLDWLATTRTHLFEHLIRNVPAQALLLAAGVPAATVAAAVGVYAVFALLGHSNLRLDVRVVERLFVTPRLHRVHHVPATTGNNFGTVFTWWDRAFGSLVTAAVGADEPLGVPGERETYPQRLGASLRRPAVELRLRRVERVA